METLFLTNVVLGIDGIYSTSMPRTKQHEEKELRKKVASQEYENYLNVIAKNHSISVMDYEVKLFLENIQKDGVILDIGGCWGWHWRNIAKMRPDVKIFIVDFVRENLYHARNLLNSLMDKQVFLIHADATSLPFADSSFDGVWTVQTFQHIPDFLIVCKEANRVLKCNGYFINYSLHITPIIRLLYKILNKPYHISGKVNGIFYLNRATEEQKQTLIEIFQNKVEDRFTETFFHPDLGMIFSGKESSFIGKIEARMRNFSFLGRWIARQRSYGVYKKCN